MNAPSPNDFLLAIDFGGTKMDLAVADLDGAILAQDQLATEASLGANQAIERALARARAMIADQSARGGNCLAAGIVGPGIILPDRIVLAPNVPGWDDLRLIELVREKLGLATVAVSNDVKAAANAELRWGHLQGIDPGVYLNLGTGIGAALVIGGRILTGAHGAAGEIGYNLRQVEDWSDMERGHAPLEEAVGGYAISQRARLILGGDLTPVAIFSATDPTTRAFAATILAELALHIANLAILVDPMRIVIGGGLMRASDHIIPALSERLQSVVPFPPEIMPARFRHNAALHGAIALAQTTMEEVAPSTKLPA